jgi:hypothetical protein
VSEKLAVKCIVSESSSQTLRADLPKIKLTAFDTYDLYFVKDLVNNLQSDNETLIENQQDLKHAFTFLLEKHRALQSDLVKE